MNFPQWVCMAILNNPNQWPPDCPNGFWYVQKETGNRMIADGLDELAILVREHRVYKGLERQSHDECKLDVQRQICATMPPGVCRAESGEDYQGVDGIFFGLTLGRIIEFSKAIFAFLQAGGRVVEKGESARRAEICRGCRLNKPMHNCACGPLWAMVDRLVPNGRHEEGLNVCTVCGCALKAKVLMPESVIARGDHTLRYPSYCWVPAIMGGS